MNEKNPNFNINNEINKIHIYSSDDEKLKFFGNVLSNEKSRKLLQMLFNEEMTASEISFRSGMSLPLINHHLTTMLQSGIVDVSKITTNSKNQSLKYYTAKSGIVILPKKVFTIEKKRKDLSNTLKSMLKFSGIGLSGIISYFFTLSLQPVQLESKMDDSLVLISNPLPIIVGLSTIGICLLVKYLLKRKSR